MDLTIGQFPNEPSIDSAEQQVAVIGFFSSSLYVVQYPFYFRTGEIRIDQQSCFLAHFRLKALFLQFITNVHGLPTLPNDRIVHRFARKFIPNNRCFALVRDPDSCNLVRMHMILDQNFFEHLKLRLPNLLGIMLDPT